MLARHSSPPLTERSSLRNMFEPPDEEVLETVIASPPIEQLGNGYKYAKCGRWLGGVLSRDIVAGGTAFVIGCVFSVSAAQTYLKSEEEASLGVQQGMVGMLLTGSIYHLLQTDVYCVTCVPDVFVALFFATARTKLEQTAGLHTENLFIDDDKKEEAQTKYVLAGLIAFILVSQLCLGATLAVVGRVRIVRISDWIPYPVARGLLAGVGICVIKMGLNISGNITACIASFVLALILRFLDETNLPRSVSFLGAVIFSMLIFRMAVYLDMISSIEKYQLSASAMQPNLFQALYTVAFPALKNAFAMNKLFFLDALRITAPNLVSMILVILLKESLSYSTISRVVKNESNTSTTKATDDLGDTIDAERELRLLGIATAMSGAVGGMYSPPSLGPMIIAQGFHPITFRGPGIAIIAFSIIACVFGLNQVAKFIPRFCCGGVLLQAGGKLIETQLIAPYSRLPFAEWLVALAIFCSMPILGLLPGVGLGLGISLALLARQYLSVGGIRYTCDGTVARSVSERDDDQDDILHDTAQDRHYVSLFGYIFFGNATPLLTYVKFILNHSKNAKATSLVLDLSFVTALDASAVDVFDQLASTSKRFGCLLALCGLSSHVERELRLGAYQLFEIANIFVDADRAIDAAENFFLKLIYVKRTVSQDKEIPSLISCLHLAAGRNPQLKEIVQRLAPKLTEIARLVRLNPGDRVQGDTRIGETVQRSLSRTQTSLYFVAKGRVVVERRPGHDSVATLASRTVLRRAHRVAAASRRRLIDDNVPGTEQDLYDRRFRIAEYGAGAVAGIEAFCLGYYSMTQTVAVSPCVLYAISFDDFRALRFTDPGVALDLLTLCATRLAKHNDNAYEQLSLIRDAFISPPLTTHPAPPSTPIGGTMKAVPAPSPRSSVTIQEEEEEGDL